MKNNLIYTLAQEYLIEMDDYQSETRDKIKIVAPENYHAWFDFVLKIRIKPQIKIISLLQLSCGGRITEILNLKKKDLNLTKRQAQIKVLKKSKRKSKSKFSEWIPPALLKLFTPKNKKKIKHRQGAIHPSLIPLLETWTKDLSPDDKLFNITRSGALKAYQKLWGITTHSLRHSYITWLIEDGHKDWGWIMNHFFFTELKTAHRYFKQSTSKEASKIFKDVA